MKRLLFRHALILVSPLLVAALFGCAKAKPEQLVVPVRYMIVQARPFAENVLYPGTVKGRYETNLGFQVGGRITERYVDIGDAIRPGQILMRLDKSDYEQNVAKCRAQILQDEANVTFASLNLKRYRELFQKGVATQADLDQFTNDYQVAVARLQQDKASLADALLQLSYCNLTSDTRGVVETLQAEVGTVVGQGTPVFTIMRGSEKEVEIYVPENIMAMTGYSDAARIPPRLAVRFWAHPDVKVYGRVREVSPIADAATRTYMVRVSIDSMPAFVQLGMTASVGLEFDDSYKSITLPLSAVFQTDSQPTVWILEGDKVTQRAITLTTFGNNQVRVHSGLNPGDKVVTAGVHKLTTSSKVKAGEESPQ